MIAVLEKLAIAGRAKELMTAMVTSTKQLNQFRRQKTKDGCIILLSYETSNIKPDGKSKRIPKN